MIELPVVAAAPAVVRLDDDGLTYETAEDALALARADRTRRVIVLAPTARAAEQFRRAHDLLRRQVIYATNPAVRGWTNVDVIVLPDWQRRRDAHETWAAMLPCMAATSR